MSRSSSSSRYQETGGSSQLDTAKSFCIEGEVHISGLTFPMLPGNGI